MSRFAALTDPLTMPTLRRAFFLLLSFGALSCGGQTDVDALQSTDAGLDVQSDGSPPPDGSSGQDAAPEASNPDSGNDSAADSPGPDGSTTFCSGASKLSYGTAPPCNVQVTSTPLAMNCCNEAVELLLHCDSFAGQFRTGAMSYGLGTPSGTYPIGPSETPFNVFVQDGREEMPAYTVSGELIWQWDDAEQSTAHLDFCFEVSAAGDILDGTRVFVNDAIFIGYPAIGTVGVSVHLLQDKTINAIDAQSFPLESLELDSWPLVSLHNMDYYDWARHWAVLNPMAGSDPLAPYESLVPTRGLPFVLVANGERIYLGALWTPLSSECFFGPIITVGDETPSVLEVLPGCGGLDPRSDTRISDALTESGKIIQ